jgi:hypothetical protein
LTILRLLRRFLRPERLELGLRPHREFVAAAEAETAYAQAFDALERVLGAAIVSTDRERGTIEAAFGLVNSERLIVTLERLDERRTRVIVEAFYPAGLRRPVRSRAVDALADALESRIGT